MVIWRYTEGGEACLRLASRRRAIILNGAELGSECHGLVCESFTQLAARVSWKGDTLIVEEVMP